MAFDEEDARGTRIVLNLIADERFTQVIAGAISEICGREKRYPTMPALMDEAIRYASKFSGAELQTRTGDRYRFEPRKHGGVNLSPATHRQLTELMLRLNSEADDRSERWSRRKLGVAAMFIYCHHLIENGGRRFSEGKMEGPIPRA